MNIYTDFLTDDDFRLYKIEQNGWFDEIPPWEAEMAWIEEMEGREYYRALTQ
jgi:hypothetical protein